MARKGKTSFLPFSPASSSAVPMMGQRQMRGLHITQRGWMVPGSLHPDMRGDAHTLSYADSTAMGASHPKLTHTHPDMSRHGSHCGISHFTYVIRCTHLLLATEHGEGGNDVLEKRVIPVPG